MSKIIKFENSDLLKSNAVILCHQVNCKGVMGSGIARTIKEKFPEVFRAYQQRYNSGQLVLGDCHVIKILGKNQYIANLTGQNHFGREPKRYTSYDAVCNALEKLSKYCKDNNIGSIAFPYKFGCDRGGANWNIIMKMIEETFKFNDITIEIHALNRFD